MWRRNFFIYLAALWIAETTLSSHVVVPFFHVYSMLSSRIVYDHYPNVIPIGEIPHEKPWYEDEAKSKVPRRYASWDPSIDPMIEALQYWTEYKASHPEGDKFKTLKDFISYITATEDWDNFRKGGLVSLIR
jgi:hypothetical protein